MLDRMSELDVMVCEACESIYRKSYDNKLNAEEYDYYINSILQFITSRMLKAASRNLQDKLEHT